MRRMNLPARVQMLTRRQWLGWALLFGALAVDATVMVLARSLSPGIDLSTLRQRGIAFSLQPLGTLGLLSLFLLGRPTLVMPRWWVRTSVALVVVLLVLDLSGLAWYAFAPAPPPAVGLSTFLQFITSLGVGVVAVLALIVLITRRLRA